MRSLLALLGALLVIFAVSGCGETVLDASKTEEQLQASLSRSLDEKVSSVDCPSDEKVEPGRTFSCSVSLPGAKSGTVTLEIRNENADVTVTKFTEQADKGNE
jgi:uncharacterized protein DUF4333